MQAAAAARRRLGGTVAQTRTAHDEDYRNCDYTQKIEWTVSCDGAYPGTWYELLATRCRLDEALILW